MLIFQVFKEKPFSDVLFSSVLDLKQSEWSFFFISGQSMKWHEARFGKWVLALQHYAVLCSLTQHILICSILLVLQFYVICQLLVCDMRVPNNLRFDFDYLWWCFNWTSSKLCLYSILSSHIKSYSGNQKHLCVNTFKLCRYFDNILIVG